MRRDLTAERLRELLHYEPDTGVFTYLHDGYQNTRHAGDVAGHSDGQGYLKMQLEGAKYRMHRLAWLYVHGKWPDADIDHINGDRSDNRLSNLRDVSRRANLENMRVSKGGVTGLLGVTPKGRRFMAQIGSKGRHYCLGRFDTAQEAHEAYVRAKRQLHEGCTL